MNSRKTLKFKIILITATMLQTRRNINIESMFSGVFILNYGNSIFHRSFLRQHLRPYIWRTVFYTRHFVVSCLIELHVLNRHDLTTNATGSNNANRKQAQGSVCSFTFQGPCSLYIIIMLRKNIPSKFYQSFYFCMSFLEWLGCFGVRVSYAIPRGRGSIKIRGQKRLRSVRLGKESPGYEPPDAGKTHPSSALSRRPHLARWSWSSLIRGRERETSVSKYFTATPIQQHRP